MKPTIMRTAATRYQGVAARPKIRVVTLSASATRGYLDVGFTRLPCALGRAGLRRVKREGDGASPAGRWPLREAFYRADKIPRPRTGLPQRAMSPNDGWCDEPRDANYNRHIKHPCRASAEEMWRADCLYDIVVVMGYNDRPRIKGRGSAIFLHCARPDYTPTQGCIALARRDLVRLMPYLNRATSIVIP